MMNTERITRRPSDAGWAVAIADAHAAEDAASRIAADAASWTTRAGLDGDDAWEAARSAVRARLAAAEAERCDSESEAWQWARAAWAAVTSALEASARVNATIAQQLAGGGAA